MVDVCVEKLLLSPESLQLTFAVTYCPAVSTFVLLGSPGFVELHICAGRPFQPPTLLPCGTADSELSLTPVVAAWAAPGEDCRGESDSGARVSGAVEETVTLSGPWSQSADGRLSCSSVAWEFWGWGGHRVLRPSPRTSSPHPPLQYGWSPSPLPHTLVSLCFPPPTPFTTAPPPYIATICLSGCPSPQEPPSHLSLHSGLLC